MRFDWRWFVVGYCCLILLQLFPSYFLLGLRRAPLGYYGSAYLLWIAIGAAVIAGLISSRSNGAPLIESLLASLLYLLTIILIYRGGLRSFLPYTSGKTKALLFVLVVCFCVAGYLIGTIARLRREKHQARQT